MTGEKDEEIPEWATRLGEVLTEQMIQALKEKEKEEQNDRGKQSRSRSSNKNSDK